MRRRELLASATVGGAATVSGCTSLSDLLGGDDEDELTIGSYEPEDRFTQESFLEPFEETLNEELDDRSISIDFQGSEAVGGAGELYDLAADGVVDFGHDLPAYQDGRLPLNNFLQLPAIWPAEPAVEETIGATRAYHELITPGGDGTDALYQEFADLDVRPIYGLTPTPYQLITHSVQVDSVNDVEGKVLRSAGPSKSDIAEALGMSSQRIAAPDMYTAHQQGTTDADILPIDVAVSYNFEEVTNYITRNLHLGGFAVGLVMGQDRWESLDSNLQDAIQAAAQDVVENYNERFDAVAQEEVWDTDKVVEAPADFEENDEQLYAYDTDAADEIMSLMEDVVDDWVDDQEEEGRPGQAVIDDFESLQEEYSEA